MGQAMVWSEKCEKSFQELKHRLTTAPVLVIADLSRDLKVYCDASKMGLGCVLMQDKKVVAYASRQLRPLLLYWQVYQIAKSNKVISEYRSLRDCAIKHQFTNLDTIRTIGLD